MADIVMADEGISFDGASLDDGPPGGAESRAALARQRGCGWTEAASAFEELIS